MNTKPETINAPYVKHSDTSKAAARQIEDYSPTLRHRVYQYVLSKGEYGATDDEICTDLQITHRTGTARRRELELIDAVYKTDQRRQTRSGRTAGVYVAAQGVNLNSRNGRPPKAAADALSVKLTVYVTESQNRKLAEMARRSMRTKTQMARILIGAGYSLQCDDWNQKQ